MIPYHGSIDVKISSVNNKQRRRIKCHWLLLIWRERHSFWFLKLERDWPYLSWTDFKQTVLSSSIFSSQANALTLEQEVEFFISWLKEYITLEVEFQHPQDLTTAMCLAGCYKRQVACNTTETSLAIASLATQAKQTLRSSFCP